jgi:1,4-alpha-glucan branching enzyme
MTAASSDPGLRAALDSIRALHHPEPHQFLGAHAEPGGGSVIRAYRPDAEGITVIADDGAEWPMRPLGQGMFEVRTPRAPGPYHLAVTYPGGRRFTLGDPYRFWPTLGDLDLYLLNEGRHARPWERLGAHPMLHGGTAGTAFAVWAPTAAGVSVVGDFNGWDGRLHPMRRMGSSGIWELFVPEVGDGARYKFEVRPASGGPPMLKVDPYAFRTEVPPANASVVHALDRYEWRDAGWMEQRARGDLWARPMGIYEVHLGSWRRVPEEGNRPLSYREIAVQLAGYCQDMGFTHVELLPVAEHPFGGSWGYQVGNYFAPTARFGHPDDLRFFVDHLHQEGIGVIIDWVPGHFPRDIWGLGRFDGSAVFEHADPRQGEQPDWGTYVFNFGRNEVRNFLVGNAHFWIEQYHVDGLRVDAVASMLYLDYSRQPGQWVPNKWGGRENEEAISFLRELDTSIRERHPGVHVIAEESTAWPKVTAPVSEGGLGFTLKWNMGWMHDTLKYFSTDPLFRVHEHTKLTFGLLYAYSEHYVLPLSHDEVVHMKGSLWGRMPGPDPEKAANLRALLAWMWAHPGRKLLFMGGELGQGSEWNHDRSLDWHLLADPLHAGIQTLVRSLNGLYTRHPALHAQDDRPEGFRWIQADSASSNVFGFLRFDPSGRAIACLANLANQPWRGYRFGLPMAGSWHRILDTDAAAVGGRERTGPSTVETEHVPWDGMPQSVALDLPPLTVQWLLSPEPGRHG